MSASTDPRPAAAPEHAQATDDGVEIVPATAHADFAAVARLQKEIWGPANTVPVPHLVAAAHAGGTVLLARRTAAGHDEPVGFCYGFVGIDLHAGGEEAESAGGAEPILWSHMLAVRPDARGRGLGRRLKLAQAAQARRRGLPRVLWTFDPLEARNAYLNLRVLGATAGRYEVNRYGHMDDHLNAGLDSDRLIADWRVDGSPRTEPATDAPSAPVLNPDAPTAQVDASALATDAVQIAVPAGQWRSPAAGARRWRSNVRAAFTSAFDHGFTAVDLRPGPEVSHYVLVRR